MQSRCLLYIKILSIVCLFGITYSQEHQGYWFKRSDTPTPRQEMPVIEYQGEIYLMGGITIDQEPTNIVEIYDPSTDTWETGTPLPVPLHHFGLAVANDKFYVFGGYHYIATVMSPRNNVYEYDPVQDNWTEKAPMPVARGEMVAITFQEKIYVMGGGEYPGWGSDLNEVYDPGTDSWSSLASLPTGRNHLDLVVIDSLIYAIGGRASYINYAVLEAYSPASDTWYILPDMPTPRGGLSTAKFGAKFYAMGGEILYPEYGIHNKVEEFDTETLSWRQVADMLTPRHGIGATTVGDTIYVISGAPNPLYGVTAANEGFVMGTCVDSDHDGYGEPENTCPTDNCPGNFNPRQTDDDGDIVGDACDICPGFDDNVDSDTDGVPDDCDICEGFDDNSDSDGDGIPDGCEYICGDANGDEGVNIGDVVYIANHVFRNGMCSVNPPIGCPPDPYDAGDVNCDEGVNIGDAVYLGNVIFRPGSPEPCASCSG